MFRLREYGLQVVFAHPERYIDVMDDIDVAWRMKDAGCTLQVSAGDILLGTFNKMAKCAKKLVKEGLCDELVSDAHCAEHYISFAKAKAKLGL